jgi:aminoglycoside 2'-N-acetyltransferase I
MSTIQRLRTAQLRPDVVRGVRALLEAAFAGTDEGDFRDEDWQHSIGGVHFLLESDGQLVGHAAVLERTLEIGAHPVRTGYVEAVAIRPGHQRQGLGSRLMRDVNEYISARFELGALGTGSVRFYERLGWQVWPGPTGVRTGTGIQWTPDEDGYILVLLTPSTASLELHEPITCEWRAGDSW